MAGSLVHSRSWVKPVMMQLVGTESQHGLLRQHTMIHSISKPHSESPSTSPINQPIDHRSSTPDQTTSASSSSLYHEHTSNLSDHQVLLGQQERKMLFLSILLSFLSFASANILSKGKPIGDPVYDSSKYHWECGLVRRPPISRNPIISSN